jgi:hypothetical protein
MVTESEIQLLRSRVNELEDRLKLLYERLKIDMLTPTPTLSVRRKSRRRCDVGIRSRRSRCTAI